MRPERIRASPRSISNGGWGHGERKFRGQHPTPEAWAKFTAMLEEGRAHRARTGKSLMVPRDAIVPIPAHVRERLDRQKVEMLAADAVEMFPAETAQSMLDFRAEDVVGKIAPRPLLLIHAANDSVTPTEQSIAMFSARRAAGRAASVQRRRPFSVQREFRARVDRAARLARRIFSCARMTSDAVPISKDQRTRALSQNKIIVGHEELFRFIRERA